MAALIAMPAVALAVLVTIMYEDRLLPQPEPAEEPASAPSAAEPVEGAAPASGPAAEPADPEPSPVTSPSTRHCKVRQDAAPQARPRVHRPAVGTVPERRTPLPPRPSRSPELRFEGVVSVPPR